MGDQENNEKNIIHSVTSVGSSWIICRSKTHSGRIYYFNTLTGEAAWNLSDPEIEKAKKRTRILQIQSGADFDSCPEPKEPPIDLNPSSCKGRLQTEPMLHPAKVYNKQIINNQFSKHTYAPYRYCSNCNTHISHSPIDDLGVNLPAPHNCTPNVWAIPPNHQIVIASTTPSLFNQHQAVRNMGNNNLGQNFPVQNTALPLSRRFNQIQPSEPYKNDQQGDTLPYFKKFNQNVHNDLRQKLAARRSFRCNQPTENANCQGERESIGSIRTSIQIIKPEMEAITLRDADDKWLQENASIQGNQLVLNVVPLKNVLISGESSSCWYVVADTNVLLSNINLINVIVNSDEQCQLMVPDFIMAELQNKSRQCDRLLMSRAHYVLQILSKLFATGGAVIGKDRATESDKFQIFHFCTKLSDQDKDVVLVSNNIQLEKCRNTSTIPLLTISELKNLLKNGEKSNSGRNIVCPLKAIKITVPNDVIINATNNDKTVVAGLTEGSQSNDIGPHVNNVLSRTALTGLSKHIDASSNTSEVVLDTKDTMDVGVQTEFKCMCINEQYPPRNDKSTITESSLTGFNNENQILKPRGIQLKRNLSHQTTADNDVEKKQFKWRRRKRFESAPHQTISDETLVACNPTAQKDLIKFDQIFTCRNNVDYKDVSNGQSRSTCYDEPNDSSETDSSCYIQKNVPDKIVIEETSTSGIISNSASNVDSEIMQSFKSYDQIYNQNINEERDKYKCAMFEVESTAMEEYLKLRCDEWISRFIQIMEEVLTQILQQDPPFFNRSLPPPWSIHEATECIKKKFDNDNDVIDAANKLTGLLFNISDGKGKIKAELKPAEFMELYSYGVYLVDSLQSVLSTCEDLQTAADSLAKLLSDIMDPNQDTGQVDSFMEASNVSDSNVTQHNISNAENYDTCNVEKSNEEVVQQTKRSLPSNVRKYNLRSIQRKACKDGEESKSVKFIRNIDIESTFFSNLNLQKNNNLCDNGKLCLLDTKEENTKDKPKEIEPRNEQKIIRNFSMCLEFEEKLKGKQSNRFDSFDNNEELEEGEIDGFDCYDEDYDSRYDYYDKENFESFNEMETNEDEKGSQFQLEEDTNVGENSTSIYNQIIRKLVNELQETFLEVHSFCEKTRDELSAMPIISATRKFEIYEKAEKARSHMDVLCSSLNGILGREDTKCENNLRMILEEAGFRLDAAKSDEYRNMVSKYSNQANILLEAVDFVIQAVN